MLAGEHAAYAARRAGRAHPVQPRRRPHVAAVRAAGRDARSIRCQAYVAVRQAGYWAEGFVMLARQPHAGARPGTRGAAARRWRWSRRAHARRRCASVAQALSAVAPHPVCARRRWSAIGLALDDAAGGDEAAGCRRGAVAARRRVRPQQRRGHRVRHDGGRRAGQRNPVAAPMTAIETLGACLAQVRLAGDPRRSHESSGCTWPTWSAPGSPARRRRKARALIAFRTERRTRLARSRRLTLPPMCARAPERDRRHPSRRDDHGGLDRRAGRADACGALPRRRCRRR